MLMLNIGSHWFVLDSFFNSNACESSRYSLLGDVRWGRGQDIVEFSHSSIQYMKIVRSCANQLASPLSHMARVEMREQSTSSICRMTFIR